MTDQSIENYEAGIDEGDYALEHQVQDKTYVVIAVILAVMTAIEVAFSYTEDQLGVVYVWGLVALMIIKFFMVAMFFMHLKFDHAMARRVFFFGLGVAVVVYCGMLATFGYWASGFR